VRTLASIRERGKIVSKFYGKAYDTNLVFSSLGDAESAVKIRTNATTYRSRGSKRRRDEVRRYRALGYRRWKDEIDHGRRWAVEGFLEEEVRRGQSSRKSQTLIAEAMQRAWAYDEMACYARARTRKAERQEKARGKAQRRIYSTKQPAI
jgi:hypothetical protein